MNNIFTTVLLFIFFFSTSVVGQIISNGKREFRGVWMATVANIDWPSKGNFDSEKQKQELIEILEFHQQHGINAIIFQIRPAADAFYSNGKELWSRYLTGQQGKEPNPFYDPLEFVISEAHKRGMELHAWFNPYRATVDLINDHTNNPHITKQQPNLFLTYGGKKLFNPGLPEVQSYIIEVIMNVVRNYDIDGVHFDDYFYPYPEKNQFLNDQDTYKTYGVGFNSIEDWRRQNVDTLIHQLSDSIHAEKKYVKFGISPFGIWRNKAQDSDGSETDSTALQGYNGLYADSKKWVQLGWVDYIVPQIYWAFSNKKVPYSKLLDWWDNHAYERHLYVGLAAFRAGSDKKDWKNNNKELPNQMRYLRNKIHTHGAVFFSSQSLINKLGHFSDSLKNNFYKYPALTPAMPWLDCIPPNPPINLQASRLPEGIQLKWLTPTKAEDYELPYGYIVYRFDKTETVNMDSPKNILKIILDASQTTFIDTTAKPAHTYQHIVSSIDRLKNESPPSNISILKMK